jgi:hypothetical protein
VNVVLLACPPKAGSSLMYVFMYTVYPCELRDNLQAMCVSVRTTCKITPLFTSQEEKFCLKNWPFLRIHGNFSGGCSFFGESAFVFALMSVSEGQIFYVYNIEIYPGVI